MYRRCELIPWPLTLKLVCNVARVSWSMLRPIFAILRLFLSWFMGYWAWVCVDQMSLGGARRHRYRSIGYSSKYCCLDGRNWQITVLWRQNSGLTKRFSKTGLSFTMLWSLIRILLKSLVQIDMEMTREVCQMLSQQQQPVVCGKFAFGRYAAGCVSALVSLVTSTFGLETGMWVHLTWTTLIPNLGTLGIWVLELFSMYAMDRRTDIRTDGHTKAMLTAPSLWAEA